MAVAGQKSGNSCQFPCLLRFSSRDRSGALHAQPTSPSPAGTIRMQKCLKRFRAVEGTQKPGHRERREGRAFVAANSPTGYYRLLRTIAGSISKSASAIFCVGIRRYAALGYQVPRPYSRVLASGRAPTTSRWTHSVPRHTSSTSPWPA